MNAKDLLQERLRLPELEAVGLISHESLTPSGQLIVTANLTPEQAPDAALLEELATHAPQNPWVQLLELNSERLRTPPYSRLTPALGLAALTGDPQSGVILNAMASMNSADRYRSALAELTGQNPTLINQLLEPYLTAGLLHESDRGKKRQLDFAPYALSAQRWATLRTQLPRPMNAEEISAALVITPEQAQRHLNELTEAKYLQGTVTDLGWSTLQQTPPGLMRWCAAQSKRLECASIPTLEERAQAETYHQAAMAPAATPTPEPAPEPKTITPLALLRHLADERSVHELADDNIEYLSALIELERCGLVIRQGRGAAMTTEVVADAQAFGTDDDTLNALISLQSPPTTPMQPLVERVAETCGVTLLRAVSFNGHEHHELNIQLSVPRQARNAIERALLNYLKPEHPGLRLI